MPRGVADNNASLSHDLSSAIVSVGSSVKHRWKGDRGSTAVTNCRSIGRVRERDTSVYAYICFRVNTLYNSYEADLGDCYERGSVVRKRERKKEREKRDTKESMRRMDHSCIVYVPKIYRD